MSKYAFPGLSIKFTEYVADFIIDSNGVWWFIQVYIYILFLIHLLILDKSISNIRRK